MRKNPYKFLDPLDPVEDCTVFIARREETDTVIEGLNKGEYWVVIGPAQIGKTTFLRQVAYENTGVYSIYLDLSNSPSNMETFYKWLIDRLIELVPQNFISSFRTKRLYRKWKDSISEADFFNFFRIFKPEIKFKMKRVVFLFDEIENMPVLDDFLRLWEKIHTARTDKKGKAFRKYSMIMTGSLTLREQKVGFGLLFSIPQILYLKDFSYEQSRQLIDEPFRQSGISIDEKAKAKLINSLNGNPQMLQQCCYFLVEHAFDKQPPLTENDADAALAHVLKENPVFTTLAQDIKTRKPLYDMVQRLLKGEHVKYSSFKEFYYSYAGAIVEGPDLLCAIRNRLFEEFLTTALEKKKPIVSPRNLLIKEPSDDEFIDNKKKNPMPCAIKQLQVRNYHGIIDTGINLPIDARWIFLTGENAYGKTILLRALTIGLFGPRDQNTILWNPDINSEIGVEIYYNDDSLINNIGFSGVKPFSFSYFAAYGPSRLEIQSERTSGEIKGRSAKTYSIFNSDGVSLNIERELLLWYLKGDPRFETVKAILLSLLPHGADIGPNKEKDGIEYTEKENDEDGGAAFVPLPFHELAAGNKSIIAMVGDLLIRFYKEYENDGKKEVAPMDFEGIVIIDELDLHLHPKWMRRLPRLLSNLFPKIQFIASTHSEIPILGAPKGSIFLKVTRTREKGIQVERLDLDIKNLLPHHLLTSPIFDLDKEIYPESNERLADMKTSENYYKALESDEIMADLRKFEESDRDFPGDLFEPD